MKHGKPFGDGYVMGCNYWASHAGTNMWSDWRPETVAADLDKIAALGMDTLRVFPLWSDFQPLKLLRAGAGEGRELRMGEEPLADEGPESDGVSSAMLDRFAQFADMADERGFSLIVGLVTGWMSGRLYAPEAFAGKDVLVDPGAIRAQVRFVECFIRELKHKKAILAWDLGNECNCMGRPAGRDGAWLWTHALSSAVKQADPDRPLVSGMHSLSPDSTWDPRDQAALTDILTTHPYPLWTPWCDLEPLDSMRALLHGTAESRFYADLGGAPCLVEEAGTMGPIMADEKTSADFLRIGLVSNWAHGQLGYLWWCAHDQTNLTHAPYDWNACERELGLIKRDGTPKAQALEFAHFKQFLACGASDRGASERSAGQRAHIDKAAFVLPERRVDGVCILTPDQDPWKVAFGAFVLAKQAGLDIAFCWHDQKLPEADLYLMPSIAGIHGMSPRRLAPLLDRVRGGATLYISSDAGFLAEYDALTGLHPRSRTKGIPARQGRWDGTRGAIPWRLPSDPQGYGMDFALSGAAGLTSAATDSLGDSALTRHAYGAGRVYHLNYPVERLAVEHPDGFNVEVPPKPEASPNHDAPQHASGFLNAYALYALWRKDSGIADRRVLSRLSPELGITEHPADGGRLYCVLINYSSRRVDEPLAVASGWRVAEDFHGIARPSAAAPHAAASAVAPSASALQYGLGAFAAGVLLLERA